MQKSIFTRERGGRGQEHVGSVQCSRGPSRGILGLRRRFYDPCMTMTVHIGTFNDSPRQYVVR